jgi:exopolysaccharide biosynthesis WecB/TagA/CpsF family protein
MTAVEAAGIAGASDERVLYIGGCRVDLRDTEGALSDIRERSLADADAPLAVGSVNLDHVHHFGRGSRWAGTLDQPGGVDWLFLVDGAPIVAQAERMTGRSWPRLAGSDLIGDVLTNAERDGVSIGFLGGTPATHEALSTTLRRDHPRLRVAGYWSPTRDEIEEPSASLALAADVAAAGVGILIVALGKPRQELWIARYGAASGARVLLAFGAAIDFLAGRVARSPEWVAKAGMEWGWRLAREPRRLAIRYLVDGPPAYREVRRSGDDPPATRPAPELPEQTPPPAAGFVGRGEPADIAVVVVTFNNADHLAPLFESLAAESADLRLRVVVTDNGSTDDTLALLAERPGVVVVDAGGNRGYAAGINLAMQHVGDAAGVLVLNPDLDVERGALTHLYARLRESRAGAVVPGILAPDGSVYPSIRREPTVLRTVGDALLGSHAAARPTATSEIDTNEESYRHPHRIDWATGAAILVHADVAREVGSWDPRFFLYSEETDFFARMRALGYTAWYEPRATVHHDRGGSGSSTQLATLMAVNRVRYARKHRSPAYAAAVRSAVILHEAMRSYDREHRAILRTLLDAPSWRWLPRATRWPLPTAGQRMGGSIVIPAHNEELVIARVLRALAPLAAAEGTEIVVACNGCTDDTAGVAGRMPGVTVVEVDRASKAAGLNAGDAAATAWPRLYLDADIELHPGAVRAVFAELREEGVLAARPSFRYDTTGASAPVRAYYRARNRIAATHTALWGAGVYALSEEGHRRLGSFPEQMADDLLVDRLFTTAEKRIVETEPARVRTPRTLDGLLAILSRQQRGNREAAADAAAVDTSGKTSRALLATVHGPLTLADAADYAGLAIVGRLRARRRGAPAWERDDSSRAVTPL